MVLTFNGEIYNYSQIRRELIEIGYKFQTNSDTEVLLALYAEKGEKMVHDLRGMFAFAIGMRGKSNCYLLAIHTGSSRYIIRTLTVF